MTTKAELALAKQRRARKKLAGGSFNGAQILSLLALQKSRCAVCRCDIGRGYHADHIIALAAGGSNDISNIQLLCPPCNRAKHTKDPIAFMQERGFLL